MSKQNFEATLRRIQKRVKKKRKPTRWQRYAKAGADEKFHWTKSNVVSYCPKCDRTFKTITLARQHWKDARHKTFRKKFYTGQRFRNLKGERNGAHKLTQIEVGLLRRLHRHRVSTYVLALYFDITQQNAHAIATGKTWKHLKISINPNLAR